MKEKNKKKIRFSITKRIASIFILSLVVSAMITMINSRGFMIKDAAKQCRESASVVATAVKTALGSKEAVYKLMVDEKQREETHKDFKYICSLTGVMNLYLYTIDENEKKHDLVCASEDEEADRKMNEEYGFGSANSRPIYDCEINVLNGNEEDNYEFIENEFGSDCMYVFPIKEKNNLIAMIGMDYDLDTIADKVKRNIRILFVLGSLLFIISYAIAIAIMRRLVIRPIFKLSQKMKSFGEDRTVLIDKHKRETKFDDEITDIEGSFDKMAKDISQYVEDIEDLAREKAQNQFELDVARRIQNGIVPMEYNQSGAGYEIYGCEHPAKDVGGDFYDIFNYDDNNVVIVVGDISGKGVSAALFMVMVKTSIKEKIRSGSTIAETLNMVNHELCMRNPEAMFATVFALMFNTQTGEIKYANAGHNSPVILKKNPEFVNANAGIVLGLFEGVDIIDEKIQLDDGEGLLIYTDGVTEAVNGAREQYGSDRLRECALKLYGENDDAYFARSLVNGVVDSVNEFSDGLEQFDDITCTALVYHKEEYVEINPDIASFDNVKQTMIHSLGNSEKTRKMILACEEIFANIVDYSQADNVHFSYERSGKVYSVVFSDNGIPFDPVNAEIPQKDFEDLDTGGMGIMIARNTSKEMIYSRAEDRNVLTMRFDL
ncbi:MAG: SpoIIE family protein phosphatase [Eubacterium sp.]|nr:SpoIIE family protein phosphatase [Eubacterium sp.]